jgi:DNA-binding transcriptional LysR family regulator
MLHLRDLYCFVKVYELRSFSRAADTLDIVQSQVSARIHRLEELAASRLFNRLHRSVAPTEKGEVVYQHAMRILDDVAQLETVMKHGETAERQVLPLRMRQSSGGSGTPRL